MARALVVLSVLACSCAGYFLETFEEITTDNTGHWIKSKHEKYSSQSISISQSSVETGEGGFGSDKALVLDQAAKHYGIATPLKEPLVLNGKEKEMVIQYEVRLQEGLDCGGAYLKLLDSDISSDLDALNNESPYIIMFGPDKCGSDSKVHFIVRHENPVTKTWEEKHLVDRPMPKLDRKTHLYTLVIRDDEENTFEIFVDQESVKSGSLKGEDFNPTFTPPKRIPDPEDKKPEDWVDEAEIEDPDATKPDDWDEDAPMQIVDEEAEKPEGWLDDEEEMIPDPEAEKPEDWDDEDDGDWEPPLVENPKCQEAPGCGEWTRPMKANSAYKGKWVPPKIANPEYKGEWKPQEIDNPAYFEEKNPARMHPIGAIAVEIWTMSGGIAFDNIWVGYDAAKAMEYGTATWKKRSELEKENEKEDEIAEKEEVRQAMLAQGGWQNLAQVYAMDAMDYAQANPMVAGGVAIVMLMLLLSVCCSSRGSGKKEKVDDEEDEADKKDAAAPASKDDKAASVRQRKKTPKAD